MKSEWHADLGKGWENNLIKEVFEHKSGYILSYRFIAEFMNENELQRNDFPDVLEDLRELYLSYKS